MNRRLRWSDHLTMNAAWMGLSTATGTITPIVLPYLVAWFVPVAWKNSYLGIIRTVSLAVAMMIQPVAGFLSDRGQSRWGRRRPYILAGVAAALPFLALIGLSPALSGATHPGSVTWMDGALAAYLVLMAGVVLWQGASNVVQGALQGLIPDLVPPGQRGTASGVKSVMELLAALPIIWIAPLVDAGRLWAVLGIVAAATVGPSLITIAGTREEPPAAPAQRKAAPYLVRFAGLTAVFVGITLGVGWTSRSICIALTRWAAPTGLRVAGIGLIALLALAGTIRIGVLLGVRTGLGLEAHQRPSFVWWVTNRLLFMAAVGSLQVFLQYYLADVLGVQNPAAMTSRIAAVVAATLIPGALGGGALADQMGQRPLVAASGLVAGAATALLVTAPGMTMVYVSGALLGLATGLFLATSWALGTDLAPSSEAGRYLGVANVAGAGAGMVGQGIGGPLVDVVNSLRPGLGYLVLYPVYGVLFCLSAAAILGVSGARPEAGTGSD